MGTSVDNRVAVKARYTRSWRPPPPGLRSWPARSH